MADIRYVQEGYVADSYVEITFDVSLSLTASATVTATGGKIHYATADLVLNQSGLTWDEMGTWQEPKQEYWQDNFTVEGQKFLGGSANLSASGTTSIAGVATYRPDITFDGVLDTTITVNLIASGIIVKLGSAELTIDADRTARSSATFQAQATFVADADRTADAIVLQLGTGTLTATANSVFQATSSIQGAVSTNMVGRAIKPASSAFTPQCTLDAEGIIRIGGNASFTMSGSFALPDAGIFITRRSPANIQGLLSTNIVAGLLAEAEVTLPFVVSTVIVGSEFAVDPYRVYTIPSETRINILQQETRSYLVPSETRNYEIQHLKLVDEPGILDRREG
jgi:hypothetical protein